MAKKYIDADSLINYLYDYQDCEIDIPKEIAEFPTADVVEVVRCKDCKYSSPNGVYGCRLERYNFNDESVRMYGEDFCSYGERRTDD